MKKKVLALILVLCMILSTVVTMSVTTFATEAEEEAATVSASTFSSAVSGDVIELKNKNDFLLFAANAASVKAGVTVKLTKSITVNGTINAEEMNETSNLTGYEKISGANFSGIFDGGENTISGLYLTNSLFAHLFGTVKDVNFDNCLVISAQNYAAIVATCMRDGSRVETVNMTNCHLIVTPATSNGCGYAGGVVAMPLSGTFNIKDCSFDGIIETASSYEGKTDMVYVGGMVGGTASNNTGTILIDGCTNTGSIRGKSASGGMIGYIEKFASSITNCTNRGIVSTEGATPVTESGVGGIIGCANSSGTTAPSITGCTNEGKITSKYTTANVNHNAVGGIIGKCAAGELKVTDTINKGEVSSTSACNIGGIAGRNLQTGTFTNCVNMANVTGESTVSLYAGGIVGLNWGKCTIDTCANLGDVTGKSTASIDVGGMIGCFGGTTITVKDSLNDGDVYGIGYASELVGLFNNASASGTYENVITTGNVYLIAATPSNSMYWGNTSLNGTKSGFYTVEGTLKYKTSATDAEWKTYTSSTAVGTVLPSADALKGMDGFKLLTAAGYDFGSVWQLNAGVPLPTTLVEGEKATVDTSKEIVYKGYQCGLAGTDNEGDIRLIAGLNDINGYQSTGFEIYAIVGGEVKGGATAGDPLVRNTTEVYESLLANVDGGMTEIKAQEDCQCNYLSAVTIENMPADGTIILTATLTDLDGGVVRGTTVMIEIVGGVVVAQYAI